MKASLGHNLGDIIDVFPFQAGCVPFLATEFKLITEYLNQFDELTRDYAMFLLIMGFSSLADNYVACVLGLEVMPDKPNIPLIASIIGGQLSAVGNMANVAQFSLDKYPLVTSFKKIYMHADTVAAGMAYSMCLDKLRKVGIFLPPNPLAPQTAH